MKSLRNSFLTLLALTLFGGAGAWAQQEVLLTTVTPTSLTTYDETTPGIVTVTVNMSDYTGANWGWCQSQDGTGTITVEAAEGYTITRCVFKQNPSGTPDRVLEDDLTPFVMTVSMYEAESQSWVDKDGGRVYGGFMTGASVIEVYGYANAPAEIELTKEGANQWTLGQTPDYDLELQVEYYEAHALKDIPEGWQVKVNGVDKTSAIVGDSLLITETDSVTLVPTDPRRVKSVTLEDEVHVQTVDIGGVTLQVVEGETWRQIAQRNPGVITADSEDTGYVYRDLDTVLRVGVDYILPIDTYDSSLSYYWYEY